MKHYIPMDSGDEQDALCGWRRGWAYRYRAGERASIKRRFRRRERRELNRRDQEM